MTVDFALNLIWLVLGAGALLATRCAQVRSRAAFSKIRFVSVVVVLAALFPYISALDDTLQLAQVCHEHDQRQAVTSTSHPATHSGDLVWLFESLNDVETDQAYGVAPQFVEYAVTIADGAQPTKCPSFPSNGRAPPAM